MGEGLAAIRKKIEDAFNQARTGPAPIVNPRRPAMLRPLAERAAFLVRASEIAASRLPGHDAGSGRVHRICVPTETAEELFEEALASLGFKSEVSR
jgi:hypothetical protein